MLPGNFSLKKHEDLHFLNWDLYIYYILHVYTEKNSFSIIIRIL